jgi:hypothetical protein
MDIKEFFKWGAVILVVLVVWRFLANMVGGFSDSSGMVSSFTPAQFAPNPYVTYGVYGPVVIPKGNPFYSSPDGSGNRGGKRWNRPRPM